MAEITRVYASDRDGLATTVRVALDALPDDWRSHFVTRLAGGITATAT